jgi:hypothetical protein
MSEPQQRRIDDPGVLAALAHPLRRRLIDVLSVEGPATVSALAERTGQRVGNISHHVKVLASAGFLVEDTDRARDRREHWWRTQPGSIQWASAGPGAEPSAAAVATAAEAVNLDQHVGRVRQWQTDREGDRQEWADAAFATDVWLRVTPAELAEVGEEIQQVLLRWSRRELPDDTDDTDDTDGRLGRRPVFVFAHGVPARP